MLLIFLVFRLSEGHFCGHGDMGMCLFAAALSRGNTAIVARVSFHVKYRVPFATDQRHFMSVPCLGDPLLGFLLNPPKKNIELGQIRVSPPQTRKTGAPSAGMQRLRSRVHYLFTVFGGYQSQKWGGVPLTKHLGGDFDHGEIMRQTIHRQILGPPVEVRRRVPDFCSVVDFSRGTLPTKKGVRQGTLLVDLGFLGSRTWSFGYGHGA